MRSGGRVSPRLTLFSTENHVDVALGKTGHVVYDQTQSQAVLG